MRIAMLLHKSAEHDARVRREAKALQEAGHEVVIVHLQGRVSSMKRAEGERYELRSASPGRSVERLPGPMRRALTALGIARIAARDRPDAVHAHDAAMLVPGWMAARRTGARLVYDSHELATGVPYRSPGWAAVVASVERLIVGRCDAVITVSEGIAERLQGRYGLSERPTVVRNLPDLPPPADGRPAAEDLRATFGIDGAPLVLHQGAVAAGRGCESLLRALGLVEEAHLLFLGAEGSYVGGLQRLAAELGLGQRVHFHQPVRLTELLSYSAQADVGVTLLEDTCENHRLALPNKAFEYVAAGIPVVASELPELKTIVDRFEIGWTVDPADPAGVAAGIRAAIGAREDTGLRDRLRRAANELSWDRERARLVELYARL